ncbi:hypothetical protein E3N88_16598 [Mikania micrantha]|uniref:Uncharacterized protein n=1 Tax=Mikania micrantha TaxID=192012 RepID=A0A5N6P036_9ASTR|nr:hypothetical protein E3N88_16598 [Mikania micrantha]
MDPVDLEIAKTQEERKKMEAALAPDSITFDTELYDGNNRFQGYNREIPANDDEENADAMNNEVARKLASFTAPKSLLNDMPRGGDDDSLGFKKSQKIIDREDDYRRRRLNQVISPERHDAFASGDKTPKPETRTYADVMREAALKREKEETLKAIARKKKEEEENKAAGKDKEAIAAPPSQKRRNRWDQSQDDAGAKKSKTGSDWDMPDSTPGIGRWDATPTPGRIGDATPSMSKKNRWDETPTPGRLADSDATPAGGGVTPGATPAGMAWDATPKLSGLATPTPKRQRSRWDETPATMGSATPGGATPAAAYTPGVTPVGGVELATPTPGAVNLRGAITPEQYNLLRWEKDIEDRNRPLTDEELDTMFPQEGYKILEPPANYVPIRTPARKLLATPTPLGTPLYAIPEENRGQQFDVPKEMPGGLPFMKPEDYQYFGALLNEEDEEELSPDEQKERKIMKLLLKVKNGTPPQRKTALRQLTDKAREFGAGPLFNRILPLLMQPTLEDQERHLLVKVIDRVLYKLDELVRPYVHKILVVIEPLLIDEDYYARVEGREIISNLSKAAGLATMIAAMRPDIDNIDEYVRNTTARAFSVVASALGIPALLPFLKAVCQSKKSWQARHTGIKIVQQIAILIGCAVLPHLRSLVEIIEHGLNDENQKVRTITALSLAALAEAAAPYGIESFDSVLKPLWKVGVPDIVARIVEDLKDESEPYRRMVMETIEKVVENLGASDIDSRLEELLIDVVMKQCQEEQLMGHLGVVLYEYLGEEYPELLEMLKAHKKGIRRATVNTFGYIAKAIGPQDVLATLLNNLKVQERQNRVCTTVAIAIVAETCSPFTVLPALMNEYRVPELNVQNGVLKSLSFLFEYIGEMGKDYIYAVTPLLEDALMDRDLVHRQTAASAVKHMALGVAGLGCEDALVHLLNYVWPNIFETSPHVINAVMEAIEGMRVALGAAVVLNYCLQGLFHPARKVREVYWKIYNSLYIGAQDALVAAYPVLEDEGDNVYSRPELTMFI